VRGRQKLGIIFRRDVAYLTNANLNPLTRAELRTNVFEIRSPLLDATLIGRRRQIDK